MTTIKLVCFDIDDTLISDNSWEKLNIAFGITPEEDYAMYTQFKNGEITYPEWTSQLAELYRTRGMATKTLAEETLADFALVSGAAETAATLREKGYELAVLSGSFHLLAEAVADSIGAQRYHGCAQLQFDESGNVTDLVTHVDEEQTKLQQLQAWCGELGIDINEAACIADGANDRAMFRATGRGITFPDSPVKDDAWRIVADIAEVSSIL